MTLTNPDPDTRVIPGWELCDRMVRSLRHLGMDRGELAELLGVRRETVGRWLLGQSKPSRAWLLVWADVTGVDPGWLEHGHIDELCACRDSNPKPSDLESGLPGAPVARRLFAVDSRFTANRAAVA